MKTMIEARAVTVEECASRDLIEQDPFRQGQVKPVQVWLDPGARTCRLETYSPGQGVPESEWHGRVLALPVQTDGGAAVDAPALVEWLRGEDGQDLLARICAGHEERWDGSNHVGHLDEDALEAQYELESKLDSAPGLDGVMAGVISPDDWASRGVLESMGLMASSTDDECAAIASKIEAESEADLVEWASPMSEWVEGVRDDLKEKEEEEEEEEEEDEEDDAE